MKSRFLVFVPVVLCILACTSISRKENRNPNSVGQIGGAELEALLSIPDNLHIRSNENAKLAVKVRKASVDEIKSLLKSDESDDPVGNTTRFWANNKAAYYRWDLESSGEIGLISDITKEILQLVAEGVEIDPTTLPTVVVIENKGQQRIVGFGATYGGEVKFHSDSMLRKSGYKGIGTVLIADYLRWCLQNSSDATFEAVNNSYKFYERFGFEYENPEMAPANVSNPESARYAMRLKMERIPEALRLIKANDQ
ncbi:hypothetical protein D3C87_1110010 [compost metagenome]